MNYIQCVNDPHLIVSEEAGTVKLALRLLEKRLICNMHRELVDTTEVAEGGGE